MEEDIHQLDMESDMEISIGEKNNYSPNFVNNINSSKEEDDQSDDNDTPDDNLNMVHTIFMESYNKFEIENQKRR